MPLTLLRAIRPALACLALAAACAGHAQTPPTADIPKLQQQAGTLRSPVPGENAVYGLKIEKNAAGKWAVEFDYHYLGDKPGTQVRLRLIGPGEPGSPMGNFVVAQDDAQAGSRHVSLVLDPPYPKDVLKTTTHLYAELVHQGRVFAMQPGQQVIDWPDWAGSNVVRGLVAKQEPNGRWRIDFDYYFAGGPRGTNVTVALLEEREGGQFAPYPKMIRTQTAVSGAQHVSALLERPDEYQAFKTTHVEVAMSNGDTRFGSQRIPLLVNWPDRDTWVSDRLIDDAKYEDIVRMAVEWIDMGSSDRLAQAKQLLERLLVRDPRNDAAYVELARVAMKSNRGPEGLHQAETLLESALRLKPDSVNAKILLGYVYAHQSRHQKAEALFTEAARADPPNQWLWANWGQSLAMQGKTEAAIQKYLETFKRPRSHDTYDKARLDAYAKAIELMRPGRDRQGLEALYKRRMEEFGKGTCYASQYAAFILMERGDHAAAIPLATQALEGDCDRARESLGLAYYAKWAQGTGDAETEALNKARIYLPGSARLLYLLAFSDHLVPAAKRLLAAGESIERKDNEGLTPLGMALRYREHAAARRLLQLGANKDARLGGTEMPVALIPVLNEDVEGVLLMKKAGVDYAKLRFQGVSAQDIAKHGGNKKLLELLAPRSML